MKHIFVLEGLNCANCAEEIRMRAEKIYTVKAAEMNFITKKLTLTDTGIQRNNYTDKVRDIVKQVEPDVNVVEYSESSDVVSKEKSHAFEISKMAVSAILLATALFIPMNYTLTTVIAVAAYLITGYEILIKAVKNIFKGNIFDECFLMTIASLGAFIIGEHEEAVGVMLFYTVGEFFNNMAVEKSRKSISKLMDLKPDFVNIMRNGVLEKVSPQEISVGDTIIVKPGEKIAIDGIVKKGRSTLDTLAITGESLPMDVEEGNSVISGCINLQGVLEITASAEFGDSTVSKILELTENAQNKKSKTESFITRFARIYTPAIVTAALLLAVIPSIITGEPSSVWIYRALSFLVVSCPCALVLSIPLSYFSGIGSASAKGILVKGGAVLDRLAECDTLVFDKTGTLTKGKLTVSEITAENSMSKEKLLEYAAYAEAFSSHPIAEGIRLAFGREIIHEKVKCEEIAGKGIKAEYDGKTILCGKSRLLAEHGINAESNSEATAVLIAVDGVYSGSIKLADEIKDNAAEFISDVKRLGIKKTVMLTGDKKETGEKIGKAIGIDEIRSELLPGDKVHELERLIDQGYRAAYTGDGINDAPVLARADVGIAMGGMGADAAIEAADIVIMNDDIRKIFFALKIADKTKFIVRQNIVFSLSIKFLILILSAFGITNMWWAVFADVGVSLIAIINSLRNRMIKE